MTRRWAALVVLWSCFGLAIASTRFGFTRFRTVLIFFAIVSTAIVVRARLRGWRPGVPPLTVFLLLALQLLLALLGGLAVDPGTRLYTSASLLLLTGCGWLAWIETRALAAPAPGPALSDRTADVLAAGCVLVAVVMVLCFRQAHDAPLVASVGELMYRMQAAALAGDAADFLVSPDVLDAFRLPSVAYAGDTLVPRAAGGWPVLLALAERLGIDSWLAPALTVVNVVLAAMIARRLWGARAGLLAAAFVAFNPLIGRFGPSWLAHAFATTLLLGGLRVLLPALEEGQRGAARAVIAGLLFAMALVTRPVAAAALIVALLVWLHVRTAAQPGRPLLRVLPALAAGAAPLILAVAAANDFSFRWDHGELFAGGIATGDVRTFGFEVAEAVKADWFTFGAMGLIPLAGMLVLSGVRLQAPVIAGFTVLPLVLIGVVGGGVHAYHDLVPFLALGFAWSILELGRRDDTLARAAAGLTLAGALLTSVLLLYSLGRLDTRPAELHARVQATHARWGELLVFLPNGTPDEVAARLWTYNLDGVGGPVLVARETTPFTNRRVLAEHAGRQVVLLRRDADGGWAFEPLVWHLSPEVAQVFLPRLDRSGGRLDRGGG